MEIVRWAKARGVDVTAEVTPHHLLLTDELVRGYDPVYKVNPPLRTDDDVARCGTALADGTIDVVATDHAPHPVEDKDCEWAAAAMGMTGLETALSVVQQALVETGQLDWAGVARVMSRAPGAHRPPPRERRGPGRLAGGGEPANLVLVDPAARRAVDPAAMATKGRNSPFAGRELPGRVVATFCAGHPTVLDGVAAARPTASDREAPVDQVIAGVVAARARARAVVADVARLAAARAGAVRTARPRRCRRRRLDGEASPEAAATTVTGTYVSTVLAGRPLERVVAHGLGTRSLVEVALERPGSLAPRAPRCGSCCAAPAPPRSRSRR